MNLVMKFNPWVMHLGYGLLKIGFTQDQIIDMIAAEWHAKEHGWPSIAKMDNMITEEWMRNLGL